MRRGAIACFERGALNLRGNRRLLWTLLLKSGLNLIVAGATIVPVLYLLGLNEAYLGLMSGRPEVFVERVSEWSAGFDLPPQLPWVVLLVALSGVMQMFVQTFFDAGALGILAGGDRQAPHEGTIEQPLSADWFETFGWREFLGRGGQLIWRLLAWRLGAGFFLMIVTVTPFVLLGLVLEGTRGVALAAGCFAALIAVLLMSLVWLWWWVVEMHMAWLSLGSAVRHGSRSFLERGGSWLVLTGIGGLLLLAAFVPVLLLASSLQLMSGSGITAFIVLQVVSGLLQGIVIGAAMFLIWAAAIALARGDAKIP